MVNYQPWPMTAVAGGNLWLPAPQPNDDDDELVYVLHLLAILSLTSLQFSNIMFSNMRCSVSLPDDFL